MTNIEQAIKMSIEGGYDYDKISSNPIKLKVHKNGGFTIWYEDGYKIYHQSNLDDNKYIKLLDKNFWICLGKKLGWDDEAPVGMIAYKDIKDELGHTQFYWNYVWHSFIDALSRDESIEEFFSKLIK